MHLSFHSSLKSFGMFTEKKFNLFVRLGCQTPCESLTNFALVNLIKPPSLIWGWFFYSQNSRFTNPIPAELIILNSTNKGIPKTYINNNAKKFCAMQQCNIGVNTLSLTGSVTHIQRYSCLTGR